jgi:hypothetical protein
MRKEGREREALGDSRKAPVIDPKLTKHWWV